MSNKRTKRRSHALIESYKSQHSSFEDDTPTSSTLSTDLLSLHTTKNSATHSPRRGSLSSVQSYTSRRGSNSSTISIKSLFAQAHDPESLFSTEGIAPMVAENEKEKEERLELARLEALKVRRNNLFMDGLLKTSMHLIDEKDQWLNQVENLLLPLLDSLLSTGAVAPGTQLSKQLIEAHGWALSQFVEGGVSLPGASRYDVRLCGWLGKLGKYRTKIQKRWIELSGQTLSYFADEKNGLELRGCLDLEGCTCRPLTNTSFELRAGGGKKSVIKKTNNTSRQGKFKEKNSYTFSVENSDDLHMWTVAIQEAINQPELRRVKKTCAAIVDIYKMKNPDDRIDQYCKTLKNMAGDRWLRFPSDWLHQQVLMKTAKSNGQTVEGFVVDDRHQAKDLAQVYKDVVRDTVVIDGREYVCASGDIIIQSLFSQIYDLFRRHHCIGVGEEEEEGDDCQKDHYITKNALAYTRAVLLASCRTVSGGDTYDAVDFMLRNEEICVICPDSEYMAPVRIDVLYETVHGEDGGVIPPFGGKKMERASMPPRPSLDVRNGVNGVNGVLLSGDGDRRGHAKSLNVRHNRARSVNDDLFENGSDRVLEHPMSSPALLGTQTKLQGLRERFRSPQSTVGAPSLLHQESGKSGKDGKGGKGGKGGMGGMGGKSTGGGGFHAFGNDSMELSKEEMNVLEAMAWPTVRVEVESRYRVMDADPMSGRSDDPLMAKVQTKFTRSFAWGLHTYCKPAEVLVKILPNEEEEEEESSSDEEQDGATSRLGRSVSVTL